MDAPAKAGPGMVEVLAAAVGSGGVLSVALGWAVRAWGRRKARQATRGYEDLASVYRAMTTILGSTRAHRVLLLASSNGGGRPAPGVPVFIDALHEVRDDRLGSLLELWRRRPLDKAYAQLLEKLAVNGWAHVLTDELPPGQLRTQYEADGVVQAHVQRTAILPRAMIWLAVEWTEGDAVEPRECAAIEGAAARVAEILRRNRAVVG